MLKLRLYLLSSVFMRVFCISFITAMDMPRKMIKLELPESDVHYYIAPWKVQFESETLAELYAQQKKRESVITVPNITWHEMNLFSEALDKSIDDKQQDSFRSHYCALSVEDRSKLTIVAGEWAEDGKKTKLRSKRLTAQLADICIPSSIIQEHIIRKCPIIASFFNSCQLSMIVDNVHSNTIQEFPFYSYKDEKVLVQDSHETFMFAPSMQDLVYNNVYFEGTHDKMPFMYEGKLYHLFAQVKTDENITFGLSYSAIENEKMYENELNIWQLNPYKLLKKIVYGCKITRCTFSPDGKWLAYSSTDNHQFLYRLTLSEDIFTLEDDTEYKGVLCFNPASTLLARASLGCLEFFDTETRACLTRLFLDEMCNDWCEENVLPAAICFNQSGNRLISILRKAAVEYRLGIAIFDISDLANINLLRVFVLPINCETRSFSVIFKKPEEKIAALVLDERILFCNVVSGELLMTVLPYKVFSGLWIFTNVFFIPDSTLVLIGSKLSESFGVIRVYDYMSGKYICRIQLKEDSTLEGIGLTYDFKHLVLTFNDYVATRIGLMHKDQCKFLESLKRTITLVDFYALLQVYGAKEQQGWNKRSSRAVQKISNLMQSGISYVYAGIDWFFGEDELNERSFERIPYVSQALSDYIQKKYATDKSSEELSQKYIFNDGL